MAFIEDDEIEGISELEHNADTVRNVDVNEWQSCGSAGAYGLIVRSDSQTHVLVTDLPDDALTVRVRAIGATLELRGVAVEWMRASAPEGGRLHFVDATVGHADFQGGRLQLVDTQLAVASGHVRRFTCHRSLVRSEDGLRVEGLEGDKPLLGSVLVGIDLPDSAAAVARIASAAVSDSIVFNPLSTWDPSLLEESDPADLDALLLLSQALRAKCPDVTKVAAEVQIYYATRAKSGSRPQRTLIKAYGLMGYGVGLRRSISATLALTLVTVAIVCIFMTLYHDWSIGPSHVLTTIDLYLNILVEPLRALGRQPLHDALAKMPIWAVAMIRGLLIGCYAVIGLSLRSVLQPIRRLDGKDK